MHIKPYLPFIGIAAFGLLVGLIGGYLNLRQRLPTAQPLADAATIEVVRPTRALPGFDLRTVDGGGFSQASLNGQWSLLYFGFTHDPAACTATLKTLTAMRAALAELPTDQQPHIYFISVDPDRDTPTVLKQFLRQFDPEFTAVTGSLDQLRKLADALGAGISVPPAPRSTGQPARHVETVMVIDPEGRETAVYVAPLLPAQMVDNYRFILSLHESRS